MAVYDKNGRMIKSSDDRIGKDIGMTSNGQEIKVGESHDGKYRIYKDTHRGAYYLTERNNVKDMISFNSPSVETRLERWVSIYDIELNREYLNSSRKSIKSVYDDRTGKDDYETKWEYVDELCDRAIEAMDGDRDAMFFNSHLNDNGFVIKGRYIDMIEDNHSSWGYSVPNDLWQDVCKSLAMDKLARITKAVERKNGQLEVDWAGNGLMNSLNRNENSLRAVFGK